MANSEDKSFHSEFLLITTLVIFFLLAFMLLSSLNEQRQPELKGTYLLDSARALPHSVSVASILTDGKAIQTVALSPKCTLSAGATIQFIEPLLGDLIGSSVYRIDEPNNTECPDKRFYITMPFKVADELIKNRQPFVHDVKISEQEAATILKAEYPSNGKSQ